VVVLIIFVQYIVSKQEKEMSELAENYQDIQVLFFITLIIKIYSFVMVNTAFFFVFTLFCDLILF